MSFRFQKSLFVGYMERFKCSKTESHVDKQSLYSAPYRGNFYSLSCLIRLKFGLEQPAPMVNQPRSPLRSVRFSPSRLGLSIRAT